MAVDEVGALAEPHALGEVGIVLFGLGGRKHYVLIFSDIVIVPLPIDEHTYAPGEPVTLAHLIAVIRVPAGDIGEHAYAEDARPLRADIAVIRIVTGPVQQDADAEEPHALREIATYVLIRPGDVHKIRIPENSGSESRLIP